MPTVARVTDLGRSGDGQAEQLLVQSSVGGGDQTGLTSLINNLRSAIARAGPPSGLQVHLAGAAAIQVDQQKKTGSTGNQEEALTVVFILVLLLLIFRSLLAPLITLIPAFMAVAISGPLVAEAAHHGLKVSQIAQLMLIVLVLGAGTDYGLFLVFRVREQLRAGIESKEAVRTALIRVGESITFSAATVIAALLTLLAATFQIYSQLAIPLAIGIGVMLLAGLTLLPALLAIFGRAAFWPTRTRAGTGKVGIWGRVATRVVRRPAAALITGVVIFGALAFAVTGLQSRRIRRHPERPGRHRLGGRPGPARQALPGQQRQPDQPRLQAQAAGLGRRAGDRGRRAVDQEQRAVHGRDRAAQPGRRGQPDPGPVLRPARGTGVAGAAVDAADHAAGAPSGPGGRV